MHHHCCLLDQSLSDAIVAEENTGLYRVRRAISANEIIQAAKVLLNQRLTTRMVNLVDNADIKDFLITQLSTTRHEVLAALFLDAEHHVLTFECLFSGALAHSNGLVPKTVAKRALELNAAKVILAHYPAVGQGRFDSVDKEITKRVLVTLAPLEIELFDYYVVAPVQAISLAEWGFLKKSVCG